MTTIKKMRAKNTDYLAQLLIDQKYYKIVLKEYDDEPKMRGDLAALKGDLDKERKRIEVKLKVEKRKGQLPTEEEIKEFNRINGKMKPLEERLNRYTELIQNREKALETIRNIRLIIGVIDDLSKEETREINSI